MSKIKDIINLFFPNNFSEDIIDRVQNRLADSENKEDKEKAMEDIWQNLGLPTPSEKSAASFDKLANNLVFDIQSKESSKRKVMYPSWIRYAAIWFIPLLSIGFSLHTYLKMDELNSVKSIEHYVHTGQRDTIELPDKSKVWLNSGTLLMYPDKFIGETREVYLIGEGFFDVKKNTDQPFIVKTRNLEVCVLGTSFNLSAYADGENVTTTLLTGLVRITIKGNDQCYDLKPNDQLKYNSSTGEVTLSNVKAKNYTDWKDGGLYFQNTSFDEIMKTIERTYNIKVHLQTSVHNRNRITINFNKNESVQNVMLILGEMIPNMEYHINEKEIFIE